MTDKIKAKEEVTRFGATMRSIGYFITDSERADLEVIADKYLRLFDAANKELEVYPWPNVNIFYQGLSPDKHPEEWAAAQKQAADAIRAWEASAPQEWKDAQDRIYGLMKSYNDDSYKVYQAAHERQYSELGKDPIEIIKGAKEHISRMITDQYSYYKELSEKAISFNAIDIVALGGKEWALDAAETRTRLLKGLGRLHFKALADNTSAIDEIKAYIEQAIAASPYIAPEGTQGVNKPVVLRERPEAGAIEITRTIYPASFATPIDKVSKKAFAGELTDQLQPLKMERRNSKRPVTTLASINFNAPQLQGITNLTMYDRSVYNAICTLYIRGKNEYITPQMIYQAMTGKEEAYLNPKQAEAISGSITKFMYGGIHIDATEEVNKHNMGGSLIYDTNLLHAERVTHNLNGTITECIRIIKTPVLYEYASYKDQIGNAPIAALATPVNKNEDTLALQAYLMDRIFAMRGTDPQRDIAYSSIYSAVWGKGAASSNRMQKSRVRAYAAAILKHWATQGTSKDGGSLIKGYTEYPNGKAARGITVIV